MFKIGDKVIGNAKAKNYGVTKTGWIGIVTYVGNNYFNVQSIRGGAIYNVLKSCFDLYDVTPAMKMFLD